MHAFLLILRGDPTKEVEKLSKKLGAQIMEYPIAKIEDVRNLGSFLKLSARAPTLIFARSIEKATTEALNAFLKNLEEPQENVFFALTSVSVQHVLPTIVSRCQVIAFTTESSKKGSEGTDFFEKSVGGKLGDVEKIKTREDAVLFVEGLIDFLHEGLHSGSNYAKTAHNLEILIQTLSSLKANGQVALQLANMAVSLK